MTAEQLQAYFTDKPLPAGPISYKQGEVITDPVKFVVTQLDALKMPPHTRFYQNAFMRLEELMEYLTNQNKP